MIWPWQDGKRGFSWLKSSTLALMLAPGALLLYQVATAEFGFDLLGGLTYWSGVWATGILLLALAITPASTIFRWRQLIIVRRMVGVTALAYTIAHIIIYFALRSFDFAVIAREMVTKLSLIVATLSTIGLIALGATSVDAAVRLMGAERWKLLHNSVYALTALALLHSLLSRGIFPDQYLMSGVFFWLMAWRALNHRGQGANAGALAMLAVASSLFTALFEAGSIWAFHGYKPSEIVSVYFTLALGIPPAWKMLALGLLIALAAASRLAPEHAGGHRGARPVRPAG